jgi:predicted XRE-type DNA-binding protein
MRQKKIMRAFGNIFVELGFPPEEVAILTMRADLMARLGRVIERRGWTQAEAAKVLGISQSRVSDLVRGKWDRFSIDTLLVIATRAKLQPQLTLTLGKEA